MRLSILALPLLAFSLAACGGAGNVGESCERPASMDECVGGAICTQNESTDPDPPTTPNASYTCREICDTGADCEPGFECRGVTASTLSACQPPRTP